MCGSTKYLKVLPVIMCWTFLRVTNLSNENGDNFMSPIYTESGKELVPPLIKGV
jgi:hypothetical protein